MEFGPAHKLENQYMYQYQCIRFRYRFSLPQIYQFLNYTNLDRAMWNQFLNESRSQNKFQNTPLIILGGKHSGKRTLVDSLFQISKTTIHNKRLAAQVDANKMRLKGLTTAIDYAYLNVLDLTDVDYRTHTKLEVYMIEEHDNPSIFSELAKKQLLKKAVFIIMLDFTNPWNFMSELEKWRKFINQLQQKAQFSSSQLEQLAKNLQNAYKRFKQPQFDENGKIKKVFEYEQTQQEQVQIPLPDGVLSPNIKSPVIICVNKCDLQSQVFRDESAQKIMYVLYHLRKWCVQYGASLIYTSIKNNSNLNLIYEYTLSLAYKFPLRFKSEAINEEAIFIPLGSDNPTLIEDSIMNMSVEKPYDEVVSAPQNKKVQKQEITVEQESKYFQKYINSAATSITSNLTADNTSSAGVSSNNKSVSGQQPKKTTDATNYFMNLLTGNNTKKETNRISQAEKYLDKHTKELNKKKQ